MLRREMCDLALIGTCPTCKSDDLSYYGLTQLRTDDDQTDVVACPACGWQKTVACDIATCDEDAAVPDGEGGVLCVTHGDVYAPFGVVCDYLEYETEMPTRWINTGGNCMSIEVTLPSGIGTILINGLFYEEGLSENLIDPEDLTGYSLALYDGDGEWVDSVGDDGSIYLKESTDLELLAHAVTSLAQDAKNLAQSLEASADATADATADQTIEVGGRRIVRRWDGLCWYTVSDTPVKAGEQ